jgi:hypothetical protein
VLRNPHLLLNRVNATNPWVKSFPLQGVGIQGLCVVNTICMARDDHSQNKEGGGDSKGGSSGWRRSSTNYRRSYGKGATSAAGSSRVPPAHRRVVAHSTSFDTTTTTTISMASAVHQDNNNKDDTLWFDISKHHMSFRLPAVKYIVTGEASSLQGMVRMYCMVPLCVVMCSLSLPLSSICYNYRILLLLKDTRDVGGSSWEMKECVVKMEYTDVRSIHFATGTNVMQVQYCICTS